MSKIKSWVDLPPKDLTWAEAMLEIEGVVNEEISKLNKKVKFGIRFKLTEYAKNEIQNFGEIVQEDKPFNGDLNERYSKFCFDFKNVKPSTLVDYDVLLEFYKDLFYRSSIDYLEGQYENSDDEGEIFLRNGGKYFYEKSERLKQFHNFTKPYQLKQ